MDVLLPVYIRDTFQCFGHFWFQPKIRGRSVDFRTLEIGRDSPGKLGNQSEKICTNLARLFRTDR